MHYKNYTGCVKRNPRGRIKERVPFTVKTKGKSENKGNIEIAESFLFPTSVRAKPIEVSMIKDETTNHHIGGEQKRATPLTEGEREGREAVLFDITRTVEPVRDTTCVGR